MRATNPPQAAVTRFTSPSRSNTSTPSTGLVANAILRDPDLKDHDQTVRDEILDKLDAAQIDRRLKRVQGRRTSCPTLMVANEGRGDLNTRIEEDNGC